MALGVHAGEDRGGRLDHGDVEIVAAFDISAAKVGKPLSQAIYQDPNNFVRNKNAHVASHVTVMRGPTLDGNPDHLARFIPESPFQLVAR